MTTDIKVFTDNLNEFTSGLKDKLPAVTNEEITKHRLYCLSYIFWAMIF